MLNMLLSSIFYPLMVISNVDTSLPIQPYDVIIDEIMADPSPSIGLPEYEWIELRNVSTHTINLNGCRIAKPTGKSGPIPNYILQPDSSLLICSSGGATSLNNFASTRSVTSFPSLSNTGELIYLLSPQGKTIHAVEYSDNWYQNELKKQGGWSLEMIDLNTPCLGSENWTASTSSIGATPGKINSEDALNPDEILPKLLRAFAIDSLHVRLKFNEPLDSISASNPLQYSISDGIGRAISATPIPPLFNQIDLTLPNPIFKNKIYVIKAEGIKDCVGNGIGMSNSVRVGITEQADGFDVLLNEVLFNPKSDGVDYVEIYNRSNKIINLKNLFISNLNAFNEIDNISQITTEDILFFPKDYFVITENGAAIKRGYLTTNPEGILQVNALPSFNDDEGNVIILNEQGEKLDHLNYNEDWHFKLIENREGISLERIDYNQKTQEENNWHSAASSAGYGTPGYKNSQNISGENLNQEVKILPETITPNNDGKDDIASIQYSFSEPGNVATIIVFDAAGRKVRTLQRSVICGINGSFNWDGLDDQNKKISTGIYVVYFEIFNLKGVVRKFKKVVVVG
jgi:hypothetical protein